MVRTTRIRSWSAEAPSVRGEALEPFERTGANSLPWEGRGREGSNPTLNFTDICPLRRPVGQPYHLGSPSIPSNKEAAAAIPTTSPTGPNPQEWLRNKLRSSRPAHTPEPANHPNGSQCLKQKTLASPRFILRWAKGKLEAAISCSPYTRPTGRGEKFSPLRAPINRYLHPPNTGCSPFDFP